MDPTQNRAPVTAAMTSAVNSPPKTTPTTKGEQELKLGCNNEPSDATTPPFPETEGKKTERDLEREMVKHIIDISVLEELKLSDPSIYNAPYHIRKVNEEAYTPQCVSIGPIHLDKEELKPMGEHKRRYFHFFWKRVSDEQAMKDYKLYLETKEQEIRHCYALKFPGISKEKFVDMVLLDAVFIMELLLRGRSDDYILTNSWRSRNIKRDLILLENQIPFFVLTHLYDYVVPDGSKNEQHCCFVDLARDYFAFYNPQRCNTFLWSPSDETEGRSQSWKHYFSCSLLGSKEPSNMSKNKDSCKKPKHFTDLIRYFYLPCNGVLEEFGRPKSVLRTATKLRESGVCFEKVGERSLLHMTFEKKRILSSFLCLGCLPSFLPCLKHFTARFRIPQLKVYHATEYVLRNLIAFEQCHYIEKPYICNYVSLVDSLIHTQVEVELLVEKEVIVHELGSHKEVATLVNGLCKHVVANTTCYYKMINELNKHYDKIWNRTMGALWLVYFKDLWRASSTAVGIAVLIFAVFNFLRVLPYFT